MEDASSARVRVSPGRLKKIKKEIAKLDRQIQAYNRLIQTMQAENQYLITSQKSERFYNQRLAKAKEDRSFLDAKRKALRMEAKGLTPHPTHC